MGVSVGVGHAALACARRVKLSSGNRRGPRADIVAVGMQKIEDEEYQTRRVAGIRRGLDQAEGGGAVGEDAAQFAVEIGLARDERRHSRGDPAEYLCVQSSPVMAETA